MHFRTWLAYHSRQPLVDAEIERRLASVADYYASIGQQIGERSGEHFFRIGCHVWDHDSDAALISLHRSMPTGVAGCLHWPFGITRFASPDISTRLDVAALARHVDEHPDEIDDLSAPQVLYRLDRETGRLFIANDTLGFGHVYAATAEGLTVWSNRLSAIFMFTGVVPALSERGWQTFATIGWFLERLTPFEGVQVLPPATRVEALNSSAPPRVKAPDDRLGKRLRDTMMTEPISPGQVAEGLERTFREVGLFTSSSFQIGLSSGRDSRVVAAAAIKAGANASFVTRYPPKWELEVAARLLRHYDVPWSVADRRERASTYSETPGRPRMTPEQILAAIETRRPGKNKLLEKSLAFHAVYDGDKGPNKLYGKPPKLEPFDRLILSGASGEFAHANFYNEHMLASRPEDEVVETALGNFSSIQFATPEGAATTARYVNRIVSSGVALGIDGVRCLDYFYVFGRFRRWADGNRGLDTLLPLLTPEYVLGGFARPVESRFASEFQRDVVRELVSDWADVPFGHEIDPRPAGQRPATANHPYFWESSHLEEFWAVLHEQDVWTQFFREDITIDSYSRLFMMPVRKRARLQAMCFRITWLVGFHHHVRRMERFLSSSRAAAVA